MIGCPILRAFCEGWESRPQPAALDDPLKVDGGIVPTPRKSTKDRMPNDLSVVLVSSLPGWINIHLCDALHVVIVRLYLYRYGLKAHKIIPLSPAGGTYLAYLA